MPQQTTPDPAALRALADRIESANCTGMTAAWCPLHGDCTCPDREAAMDSPTCPLHAYESSHAAGLFGR
jgi:hypothetical protein